MKGDTLDFVIAAAAVAFAWWLKKPSADSTSTSPVDDNWLSAWGLKK